MIELSAVIVRRTLLFESLLSELIILLAGVFLSKVQ